MGIPLCVPTLFALALAKEAWVGGVWSAAQGRRCWNPTFIRLFNDWELEDVLRFLFCLRDKKVNGGIDGVGIPLCVLTLFALALAKEAWVGGVWSAAQGRRCWNPTFIRLFNDWELEDVLRFLFCLRDKKVNVGLEDTVRWEGSRNVFTVKSLYKMLEQMPPPVLFPWKFIWRNCAQPKLCFFAWEAVWGKILTLDQLKRIGFAFANRCLLCQEWEEIVDHLLLHCEKSRVPLGVALLSIWSVLGHSLLGVGHSFGLMRFIRC